MSKVINKDGKWIVVDDDGSVRSTPFTERSTADSFMNLRDAILRPAPPPPARTAQGNGSPPDEPLPPPPKSTRSYGPPAAADNYGPPAPLVPASQRPWRPANQAEANTYRFGSEVRAGRVAKDEKPGWMRDMNLSTAEWRALLAGLGVQNMPSTPNPKHPEEY